MALKHIIPLLVVGLVGTSEAWAAGFEILMSHDKALCQEVLNALNNDLAAHHELRLAEHPTIPAIAWHPMAELGSPLKDTDGVKFLWARFDSNNDGIEDLVVKQSAPLREGAMVMGGTGVPSDDLFIFRAMSNALTRVRTWVDFGKVFVKSGSGRLSFGDYLLEYPLGKFENHLGDELVVNAFRYQGATYYHIDHIMPLTTMSRIHVVTTYKGALDPSVWAQDSREKFKLIHDVCYFKQPLTTSEYHPLERSDDGLVIRP